MSDKSSRINGFILSFQVSRVLHLIYRLVVQPNTSRAQCFAEAFISCGGMETLLVLLQRETKTGDPDVPQSTEHDKGLSSVKTDEDISLGDRRSLERKDLSLQENASEVENFYGPTLSDTERISSTSGNPLPRNLGGISYLISAENARNNVYNADKSDGIIVRIINLLGALVISGHLKFDSPAPLDVTSNLIGLLEAGGTMFDDKVSLLLFGLQKAFQAAPSRLMTSNAYKALLAASVCLYLCASSFYSKKLLLDFALSFGMLSALRSFVPFPLVCFMDLG